MSSTPRKRRGGNHQHSSSTQYNQQHGHQRTRSQQLAAQAVSAQFTSDYESDTASYMASHPPPPAAALAQRSNTELNMTVLRRYLPAISDIRSIAANAVVYTLDANVGSWDKSNIEGTMFVCQLRGRDGHDDDHCIFILNRKAIDNLILPLASVKEVELKDELLMLVMGGDQDSSRNGQEHAAQVFGLFIHADGDSTRAAHANLIRELWITAREASQQPNRGGQTQQLPEGAALGHSMPAIGGRQVSLTELFGR
ncbi:hypothetical protein BX600DRAFT_87210 [Xylariales sp. PMI_506]|nr:hypothetical protein BX600DRAFT_87210 [Xylariales sp. PMI_506]